MGRYYWSKKTTVEDSTKLSISKLKEFGLLEGCCNSTLTWTRSLSGHKSSIGIVVDVLDEPYVKLNYTITDRNSGQKTDYDYEVSLVTTPCNFGGVRYWFGCPDCGRWVAVLYLAPGDVYFRCRHCNNLSYHSRNESSPCGILGVTDREIKKLRSEIKRWTWRGRPTRKVRRLQALERKIGMLSGPIMAQMEKFKARLR